jgi:hypothetical protein
MAYFSEVRGAMNPAAVTLSLVGLTLAILGIRAAIKSPPPPPLPSPDDRDLLDYCPHCGTVAIPLYRKSGSTFLEVFLWLFFLVPGIIYTIWRKSKERVVCPSCDQTRTIPLDSPVAQAALKSKADK